MSTTAVGSPHWLLELWERGVRLPTAERADALLGALPEPIASLGARNAALLSLRAQLFGSSQTLGARCPSCRTPIEFVVDCEAMARELLPARDASARQHLVADGFEIEFRIPTTDDVRECSAEWGADHDAFVRELLARCIERCERHDGVACSADALTPAAADALSRQMEALEPGASVSFDLQCPQCQTVWTARMDCEHVVWTEVQTHAERLLMEVNELARAYGWSEAEVLALSATRRAAYLQLTSVV